MQKEQLGTWIFGPEGISKGSLRLEDGALVEIQWGSSSPGTKRSLVIPGFVNAHTHIGDSFAYPAPKGTLEETVAPPNGYKQRVLRTASRESKVGSMRASAALMLRTGTASFIDFREEGTQGIEDLRGSLEGMAYPKATILGRPSVPEPTDQQLQEILRTADGLGMSAVRDWPLHLMERASRAARSAGKRFALHASEAIRERVDTVLGLKPDFIVHMSSATEDDLRACAEADVPIVVCPRSNEFFGIELDLARMVRSGADLALGTDNGMIARPDMLEEMRAAYRIARKKGEISPLDVVSLATFGGRKVLNAPAKITPEIGIQDDLVVVRVRGEDPLLELCTATVPQDIVALVQGGRVWRSEGWR